MQYNARVSAEVYRKWRKGEPIQDSELETALDFFKNLANDLSKLGDRWAFACQEARTVASALEGFVLARKTK